MAYFDSAKNRALWNKEMAILREERQKRREGVEFTRRPAEGLARTVIPENSRKLSAAQVSANPRRIRSSYEELAAEERAAIGGERQRESSAPVRSRERDMELQGPGL